MVFINGKTHRLSIMKEYILKEYRYVFSGVGTLPGKEYHITLKKSYVLVQQSPRLVPVKSRQHIRNNFGGFVMVETSHLFRNMQSVPAP